MAIDSLAKCGYCYHPYRDHIADDRRCARCECLGFSPTPTYAPKKEEAGKAEAVNHPSHYGGDTTYETIKVAEAWGLDRDAYLFNAVKYISRAGKKVEMAVTEEAFRAALLEDLEKAEFYLQRRIASLKEAEGKGV